jgi:hypothetical protein
MNNQEWNTLEYRRTLLLRAIKITQEMNKISHYPISMVELAQEKRDIDSALRLCGIYK